MTPTSLFEILRRADRPLNASGKYTSTNINGAAGSESAVRGLALGPHATDADSFDLAQGAGSSAGGFIGFLTRRVTVGGLSLADRVFGVTAATPVGLESPFTDGLEVSLERGEEVELEGPSYLYSGTGMVLTSDAPGTMLSFKNGMVRKTQTGEVNFFQLTANNLTPMTTGNLRIRMVALI